MQANYFYCPSGNYADPNASQAVGSVGYNNPFQQYGAYYDPAFESYWMDGQQFDANSGNAFALNLSPDDVQAQLLEGSFPPPPSLQNSSNVQQLVFGDDLIGAITQSCSVAVAGAVATTVGAAAIATAVAPEAMVAGVALVGLGVADEVYGAVSDLAANPTPAAAAAQGSTIVANHTVEPAVDAFTSAAAAGTAAADLMSPAVAATFGAVEAGLTCAGITP